MKIKKIDLSGVKDFLFQKGERLGLALCTAFAVLLLAIGLMKAGGSTVPYAQNLAKARSEKQKLTQGSAGPTDLIPTRVKSGVQSLCFSSDGQTLASANDYNVMLWNSRKYQELATLSGHKIGVGGVSFSPDGLTLASGSLDTTVKLWDVRTLQEKPLQGHKGGITGVSFSPDGQFLATASWDQTVKLWNVRSAQEAHSLEGHKAGIYGVAYSKNHVVASASDDQTVKLWDARGGKELRTLEGHKGPVFAVAFSPDGKHVASASEDQTVKLWDVDKGQVVQTLKGHKASVNGVCFSPDGLQLASVGDDQLVIQWDAKTGKKLRTLEGHKNSVVCVAFSPDSKVLASGSQDQVTRLWDAPTGQFLADLQADAWPEKAVTFEQTPLILAGDVQDNKRRNPTILKVLDDDKHIQVDVLKGGYFAYDLDTTNQKASTFVGFAGAAAPVQGGVANPFKMAKVMKVGRMVVVTAVFPWRDQLEEYRQKLQLTSIEELLAQPQLMPRPKGLNVFRCEVQADGTPLKQADGKPAPVEWKPLFKYDANKKKLEVAERIDRLYREAVLDVENPKVFDVERHVQTGLMTPVPLLANAHLQYPRVNLQDIKLLDPEDPDKMQLNPKPRMIAPFAGQPKVAMPGIAPKKDPLDPGGMNEPEAKFSMVPWAKLPDLKDKFSGKNNFFDPFGQSEADLLNAGGVPPMGMRPQFQPKVAPGQPQPGGQPPVPGDKLDVFDAVVRFLDVDVEPGKTYVYSFNVRFANPNYKQTKDVAFQALADVEELVCPVYAYTPPVSIAGEFQVYAVEQFAIGQRPEQKITEGADTDPARADPPLAYGKWTTTVQIHRWLTKVTDPTLAESYVADWAIAERLLVRRGDTVGRLGVVVEVPVWNKSKETFEIGYLAQKMDKKKGRAHTGLPIDFIRETPPPLLVDFEGGWKSQVKVGTTTVPRDESAVDILILTHDGKLTVRNSRADTDPDNPVAAERNLRWEKWREGLRLLRMGGGGPNAPGGINMPGGNRGS